MYIFASVSLVSNGKQNLPSWHRKAQKAYHVNRVISILQMVAALVMCGVILYAAPRMMVLTPRYLFLTKRKKRKSRKRKKSTKKWTSTSRRSSATRFGQITPKTWITTSDPQA